MKKHVQWYAVQGLYLGNWKTLFSPYFTRGSALDMLDHLADKNPDCLYRVVEIESDPDADTNRKESFQMKMSDSTYLALAAAIEPFNLQPDTTMRQRWDSLWASGFDVNRLYAEGLNDNHIDTALRRIARTKPLRGGLIEINESTMVAAHKSGMAYWNRNKPQDATRDKLESLARSLGWHGANCVSWVAGFYGAKSRDV